MIQKTNNRLTKEALSVLRKDTDLCITVAKELGISMFTIPSMISRNSRRLTELSVVNAIAEKLGKSAIELVEATPRKVVATPAKAVA